MAVDRPSVVIATPPRPSATHRRPSAGPPRPPGGLPAEPEALVPLPPITAAAVKALARILPPLNRWFMIPALRHGLGAWIGTPIGGYIALLRVRGRRTGRIRETPLTYLIADGSAWVMAGFGTRTQWYANLLADPIVEVVLPGRTVRARASEAGGPAERSAILPRLVRAAGAPGLLVGCVPWTSPDEQILALLEGVPLVRLTPLEGRLIPGPDDPGGTAWLPRQALMGLVALGLVRVLRGRPDQPRAASRP